MQGGERGSLTGTGKNRRLSGPAKTPAGRGGLSVFEKKYPETNGKIPGCTRSIEIP